MTNHPFDQPLPDDLIRAEVRNTYSRIAISEASGSCCAPSETSCCAPTATVVSSHLGYSESELEAAPLGADLGLGCGNPQALAALQPGETVLDLGSGAGFDVFLAAKAVTESGRVIGVDMTPDMISKARSNALKTDYTNVEFRLGEIENLPVADSSIDAIISNCVINLSPDKAQVFRDAFRVLRPGGRLAISDVVATTELPETIANDLELYSGCMSGASLITDLRNYLADAGFTEIRIVPKDESKTFIETWAPGRQVTDYVVSATIEAIKPGQ